MSNLMPGAVVDAVDKVLSSTGNHPRANEAKQAVTAQYKPDPSGRTMHAVTWTGTKSITTVEVPKPTITDPDDVIVRITSSAICGSDLHLYLASMPGMKSGAIMGHEPMGIVEEVGPNVKNVKKGDRVVCSFDLACGSCFFCQRQHFSGCDRTNPNATQEVSHYVVRDKGDKKTD
jgi:threonine dehydrogenase-like Zn-dependent dehydrogenase